MSACALGTLIGVQFAAVFQSPLVGLSFQAALPAKAVIELNSRSNSPTAEWIYNAGFEAG